jgi:hypothetical protein
MQGTGPDTPRRLIASNETLRRKRIRYDNHPRIHSGLSSAASLLDDYAASSKSTDDGSTGNAANTNVVPAPPTEKNTLFPGVSLPPKAYR